MALRWRIACTSCWPIRPRRSQRLALNYCPTQSWPRACLEGHGVLSNRVTHTLTACRSSATRLSNASRLGGMNGSFLTRPHDLAQRVSPLGSVPLEGRLGVRGVEIGAAVA